MNARRFWEEFRFEYHLDNNMLWVPLVAIEAHRQAADKLILAPEWREQMNRLNRVRAVYGTTAIEGKPVESQEVV